MATIYQRKDSQAYWLACYPRAGGQLVRAGLQTRDLQEAEKIREKVELLIALEKLSAVALPEKLLQQLSLPLPKVCSPVPPTTASAPVALPDGRGEIRKALEAYLRRASQGNVHAFADKISRLRQFFGSALINELDSRPPEQIRHAGKHEGIKPYTDVKYLSEITPDLLLSFLNERKYGRCSRRHFRELFFGLFRIAMVNGIYVPSNIFAPNPTSELPTYAGREEPVVVLSPEEVQIQYNAVASDKLIRFGCELMIEGGFRLHEILVLRPEHISQDCTAIALVFPTVNSTRETKLKTGERPVSVREQLRPIIKDFLTTRMPGSGPWLFPSPRGVRLGSDAFGARLRELNRAAGLSWTTQDFRHSFATNRLREGWNLKTLADEMGTSLLMLMEYYAGVIKPPILAAQTAASSSREESTTA